MSITVEWLGHSSFRLTGSRTIYIDPWKVPSRRKDGDIVLISHSHHDHFSAYDIKQVTRDSWNVLGPEDVIQELGIGRSMVPTDVIETEGVRISALRAYTIHRLFHPVAKNWLGFIIEMDDVKLYYAGDTDVIPEMREIGPVDIALLPVPGVFTMDAQEAAQATQLFKAACAIPYHWGDTIGSRKDAERFARAAACKVIILDPQASMVIHHTEGPTNPDMRSLTQRLSLARRLRRFWRGYDLKPLVCYLSN